MFATLSPLHWHISKEFLVRNIKNNEEATAAEKFRIPSQIMTEKCQRIKERLLYRGIRQIDPCFVSWKRGWGKNLLTTAPSGFRHQNLLVRIGSEDFSMRKGAFFALMSIFWATSEENACKMLHLKYGCVVVSKLGGLT